MGALVASPRRGESEFDPRDRAVLADLARQAGPRPCREALTADLLDSRQRPVTAGPTADGGTVPLMLPAAGHGPAS